MRFLFFVTITFLAVISIYAQIETAEICNQMEFVNKLVKNPYKVDSIIKSSTFYDSKAGYKLSGFKEDRIDFIDYFKYFKERYDLYLFYTALSEPKIHRGKLIEKNKPINAFVLLYRGKDQSILNRLVTFEFIQNEKKWYLYKIYLGTSMYIGLNPEEFFPPRTRAKKYGEE